MTAQYLAMLAMGFGAGFSHCIGMCGIFVVAYSGIAGAEAISARAAWMRHLQFHSGRLLSLAGLGFLAGLAGTINHGWSRSSGIFGLAAAVVMAIAALALAGWLPGVRLPEPDVLGMAGGRGRRLYGRILRSQSALKPLGIGLVVGLLPCGFTYQAMLPAVFAHQVHQGVVMMLAFGIGSTPGLLVLGVFGNTLFRGILMQPRFRLNLTRISAIFMLIAAGSMAWKAWQLL